MRYKKFLIPVGVAVAALISSGAHASENSVETHKTPSLELAASTKAGKESSDPVLKKLLYQIGAEEHALLLRKPASKTMYAQHGSHMSHSSHESHYSHQSHRSGG